MGNDTVWFWKATFTNGSIFTFYADSKALALDHAGTIAQQAGLTVKVVKRLGHSKDVTATDHAFAGRIHEAV